MAATAVIDLLVKLGLLDDRMHDVVMSRSKGGSGGDLVREIAEQGFATESTVARVLSVELGLPRVDLAITPPEHEALGLLDMKICTKRFVLPVALRENGEMLWLAMGDPTDSETMSLVRRRTGKRVRPVVAGPTEIAREARRLYVMPQTPGSLSNTSALPGATQPSGGIELEAPDSANEPFEVVGVGDDSSEPIARLAAQLGVDVPEMLARRRMLPAEGVEIDLSVDRDETLLDARPVGAAERAQEARAQRPVAVPPAGAQAGAQDPPLAAAGRLRPRAAARARRGGRRRDRGGARGGPRGSARAAGSAGLALPGQSGAGGRAEPGGPAQLDGEGRAGAARARGAVRGEGRLHARRDAQEEQVSQLSLPFLGGGAATRADSRTAPAQHPGLARLFEEPKAAPPAAPVPALRTGVAPSDLLAAAARLAEGVMRHLREPVEVELTDNAWTMVSYRRVEGRLRFRLHHMFAGAGDEVLRALAGFTGSRRRQHGHTIDLFVKQHRALIRAAPDGDDAPLVTRGSVHDLQELYDRLNRLEFGGRVEARIGWGRRAPGRRRRSIKMGVYLHERRLIRIHPALDDLEVPRLFVELVVFHEMLHQIVPPSEGDGGRRCVHGRAFREAEKKFPGYEQARAWEKANLHVLLRKG